MNRSTAIESKEIIPLTPKKLLLTRVWLILLLLVPIVLWVLPANFFDESSVVVCPSKLFFDFDCLGCGMTRAVMHLHHFDFDDAVYFNQGVFIVYPALAIVWCIWVYKAFARIRAARN